MPEPLRVALASQTPPIRFLVEFHELLQLYPDLPDPVDVAMLREGTDWTTSAGGVPVMLRAMLPRVVRSGKWRDPVWVALNPAGPERFVVDGIRVHSVALDPAAARQYGAAKERIWASIHRYDTALPSPEEFRAYSWYNWRTANKLLEVLPGCDAAYVHDFQLLQVGALLGLSAPAVFRWHIPFRPRGLNSYLRTFIVRCLEDYDAVVVSTRRDLEGLVEAGYRGRAYQLYPYVARPERTATAGQVRAFEAQWGLRDDTPLVLVVGRMDPIKGQDRVLRALGTVRGKIPDARALLVGDGSFTSSGLGHPKGRRWRQHLETVVADEKLKDAATFTGYLPPEQLEAAWTRASVVVVPSTVEGFGTTAVEAWMRRRPVVLSRGAGASELVIEGVNGLTYEPDDVPALAGHLLQVLADRGFAERLGERGAETARVCELDRGAEQEDAVLRETVQRVHEAHRA